MATKKAVQTQAHSAEAAPRTLRTHPFYGLTLDPQQEAFRDAIWNPDIDIVFCDAKAGTGKTLVAVATATLLVKYGLFDGIAYVVSTYGEGYQGYLPGSLAEKSRPYFDPLFQALLKLGEDPLRAVMDDELLSQKNGEAFVTAMTHTFLRGSNFEHKVVILDEAQNYDVPALKKTLTRIGEGCKVIVIGHREQCDLQDGRQSGFAGYLEHFSIQERCAILPLTQNHRGWISACADDYRPRM